MTALTLRPYQRDGYGRVRGAFVAGAAAALLVLPTGGGKTLTLSEFVGRSSAMGHGVEFFAPREELLEQARACFVRQGVPLSNVRIQSVQSAIRAADHATVNGRPVRLRIFDEAHHLGAEEWGKLSAPAPGVAIIGATATPQRGDGKGLGRASGGPFDALIEVATVQELQALGVLVPCLTYAPGAPVDPKAITMDHVVAAYLSRGAGKRCLVFCRSVKGAEEQTMAFVRAGVAAVCLHGDTDANLRRARLEAFASQSTQPLLFAGNMDRPPIVICNDQLLTEGLDVPGIECIILARGVSHAGAMMQIAGRGLRGAPGKEHLVFVDLPGVTRRRDRKGRLKIGLPEDRRVWTLEGKVHDVADEDAERPLHTCPACEATISHWTTDGEGWRCCPLCRERLAKPSEARAAGIASPLHAFGSGAPLKEREKVLRALAKKAARTGFKWGWIAHRFAERFACPPPWDAAYAAFADAVRDQGHPPPVRAPRARDVEPVESEGDSFDAWIKQAVG